MIGDRRILTPDQVSPAMRWPRGEPHQPHCRSSIVLDGIEYGCKREVYGADRAHEGIHDAYAVHVADGGAVRW